MPAIKWLGSKRRQAAEILRYFPPKIAVYRETFVGGGAVLKALLTSLIEVEAIEASDSCEPLIGIWKLIQSDSKRLGQSYSEHWQKHRCVGKSYYYEVRDKFNETKSPEAFFFLLRTCRNGLVRFNSAGEFNSGCHIDRLGAAPERIDQSLNDWSTLLNRRQVCFYVRDYRSVNTRKGDFTYLDPPYQTGRKPLYGGRFDFESFFQWLGRQESDYLLSLNGYYGNLDRRIEVPKQLYDRCIQIDNGRNSFDRLNGEPAAAVTDSLYVRIRTTPTEQFVEPRADRIFSGKSAAIKTLLLEDDTLTDEAIETNLTARGLTVAKSLIQYVRRTLRKTGQVRPLERTSKSKAIQLLLTESPNLSQLTIVRQLADQGMQVTPTDIKVARHHFRKKLAAATSPIQRP